MRHIAYDITLMRPACVLVAAALKADSQIPHAFPTESWLLAPTPNMAVYPVTDEQLTRLVEMTKAHAAKSGETGSRP